MTGHSSSSITCKPVADSVTVQDVGAGGGGVSDVYSYDLYRDSFILMENYGSVKPSPSSVESPKSDSTDLPAD